MNAADEDTAKNPALPSGRTALPWLVLAVLAIVADQASKAWILARFEEFETLTLLPVLDISRWHNQGAAFSFLAGAGGWQRWLFTALAVVVSGVIVVWLRRLDGVQQRRLAVALTLIMGGAIGNVIDRIHHGFVVDFIVVHWNAHYFPAFNVADSCITIGAGLLILDALLDNRGKKA
jgi:signal peptidase II